jgi:hypothetical protein
VLSQPIIIIIIIIVVGTKDAVVILLFHSSVKSVPAFHFKIEGDVNGKQTRNCSMCDVVRIYMNFRFHRVIKL